MDYIPNGIIKNLNKVFKSQINREGIINQIKPIFNGRGLDTLYKLSEYVSIQLEWATSCYKAK